MVWVEGELSNFACPASGHWYFSLKDDNAQVRCAMFRNRNNTVKTPPTNGEQIRIRARVSLYEGRGEYQLIVEHMEASGQGKLQQQFEQLKQQLLAEGLFDSQLKRPIPRFPNRIGVITSATGAAVQDILSVLKGRFAAAPVRIYPSLVQGDTAAEDIVKALALANRDNQCDVLLLARGGGSLEDLWPFNEEIVARAIRASSIPVVSGIGHEIDTTIADFAADKRAETPSAAAALVTPDSADIQLQLHNAEQQLRRIMAQKIQERQQKLDGLAGLLRHPGERITHWQQQLQGLSQRLTHTVEQRITTAKTQLDFLAQRHRAAHPSKQLQQLKEALEKAHLGLHKAIRQSIENKQQLLSTQMTMLHAVSPLQTLERGYAIVKNEQQQLVKAVADLSVGDEVQVQLARGHFSSTITELCNEPETK